MRGKSEESKKCDKCGHVFSLNGFSRHYKACTGSYTKHQKNNLEIPECVELICPICKKECASVNGYRTHYIRKHLGLDWNLGTKKGTSPIKGRTDIISEEAKERLRKLNTGKKHTEETKQLMSVKAKLSGRGGNISKHRIDYTMKNGKIVHLHSSYERIIAEILDENNVEWTRPAPMLWVDDTGIQHRYYPDFHLITHNVYLDPKNDFLIKKDKRKIELVCKQNDVQVFIVDKDHLSKDGLEKIIQMPL